MLAGREAWCFRSNAPSNRPGEITTRQAFGHWECDLMIFRREHGPANVTSLIESYG